MRGQMMQMPLSIGALIDHAAHYHGDTGIASVETDGSLMRSTWAGVAHNARKLASVLKLRGFADGERCATMAWNNTRHLEIYFGVASAGMVCHTINPRLFSEQLIYVINHAADRALFLDKTFVPIVAPLLAELKTIEMFVLLGPPDAEAAAQIPGLISYDELVEIGDAHYIWPDLDENTASSLCYTSGTTSNPKGVLYSHRSTVLHSFAISLPDCVNISARDTILPVVPMFHANAWGLPYAAAMNGAKLVMPGPGLDGDSLVKLIEAEAVTNAMGVPTIWHGLLAAAEKTGARLESLQRTVVGGSACPPSMIETFRERYGVETLHGWGMTEMSPVGTINQLLAKHRDLPAEDQAQLRTAQGRPMYGVEMKIVDAAGALLPSDGQAQGNLMVRGPWIAASYYKSEAPSTLIDGWFPTGDVATLDADGFMTIRDRSKDIIKSGGEWISSVELENIAIAHPGLADAAVIGARHEKWDERPVLIAVKAAGMDPNEVDLIGWYEGKVERWQVPDAVIFVDEIPRNATGKALKNRLRDDHGDCLVNQDGADKIS